jgi:CIC family chloride channel protein
MVQATLNGRLGLEALLVYLVLRFALTMGSYGTGAAGGIFAPLLVLGAQAGLVVGLVGQKAFPAAAGFGPSFAVVGMAALFTAIVRAPLTGIVLILEMTSSYPLMLPLLAACFTAYALADVLRDRPIYEALLERDLLRGQPAPEAGGGRATMVEILVEEGAPFDGRRVADLGLPQGCLLITVRRGELDEVPSRDTILRAGDRLTAVVSPQAAGSIHALRNGADSRGEASE